MGSLIFGIFSGVIVIILAVLQYREKLKDDNAVLERQKKVDSANSVLIASQQQLIDQSINQLHMSAKIGVLQDKLVAESDKNALLQKELYESVTGGGNIPFLLFFQDRVSPNEPPAYLTCRVMNDGKVSNKKS